MEIAQTILLIQIMNSLIAYSEVHELAQYITLSMSIGCCLAMLALIKTHSSITLILLVAQVGLVYSVSIQPQFDVFEAVFFVLMFWLTKKESHNYLQNIGFIAALVIPLSLQEYQMPSQIIRSVLCAMALSISYVGYKYKSKTSKSFDNSSEGILGTSQPIQIKEEGFLYRECTSSREKCDQGLIVIDEDTFAIKFANQLVYELAHQVNQTVNELLDYIIIDKIDKQAKQKLKQSIKNTSLKNLLQILVASSQQMRVFVLNCNSNGFKNYSIIISNYNGLVITFQEVNERDRYLKRHYQFEIMKQLFTTFSHEFGTSLNYMLALAQTAIENFPEQTEYFEPIRCTGQILHNFVMGMVDFNDIQGKSFSLQLEEVDVNQVMYDIVQLFAHQVTKKGLTIEFEQCNHDIPLYSDARRIKEVLVNLVSNSQKFTYTGGIYISTQIIDSDHYQFSVKDSGIGMSHNEKAKLAETLQTELKLEDKISNSTAGFGLGCFLSNTIVKKLCKKRYEDGGGLQFESLSEGMEFKFQVESQMVSIKLLNSNSQSSGIQKIGKTSFVDIHRSKLNMTISDGSDFMRKQSSFFFPLLLGQTRTLIDRTNKCKQLSPLKASRVNQEIKSEEQDEQILQLNRVITQEHHQVQRNGSKYEFQQSMKFLSCECKPILIVDDEMINIMGLQIMLKQFELSSDSTFNGRDAIIKLKQNKDAHCPYAMVLMDINMPIMDGIQATREILAQFSNPPIIVACTAYVDEGTRTTCYEAGMSHFLSKPVAKSELAKILRFMNLI